MAGIVSPLSLALDTGSGNDLDPDTYSTLDNSVLVDHLAGDCFY